jgi:hypothetical protein
MAIDGQDDDIYNIVTDSIIYHFQSDFRSRWHRYEVKVDVLDYYEGNNSIEHYDEMVQKYISIADINKL